MSVDSLFNLRLCFSSSQRAARPGHDPKEPSENKLKGSKIDTRYSAC